MNVTVSEPQRILNHSGTGSRPGAAGRALPQHLVHFKDRGIEAWCAEGPTRGSQWRSQDLTPPPVSQPSGRRVGDGDDEQALGSQTDWLRARTSRRLWCGVLVNLSFLI